MRKFVMVLGLLLFQTSVSARQIEGINFPEQVDLGGQKLMLNGVGLRNYAQEGKVVKAYVAGLYIMTKTHNPAEIIQSQRPIALRMFFLRDVSAAQLRKGWSEGYAKVCKENCEATQANLKMFNDFMIDVSNKHALKLRFDEDGVNIQFDGKDPHSGHIASQEFRKNLLTMFLGDNPPTAQLKAGLLDLGTQPVAK